MSVLFLQVVSFVVLLAGMLITLLAFGMLGGRGQVGALQSAVFLQMVTMGMALTVGGALGIAVGSACDALAEVREIARRYEREDNFTLALAANTAIS